MIVPIPPARNTANTNPNATAFTNASTTHPSRSSASCCQRGNCAMIAITGATPMPMRTTTIPHSIFTRHSSRYPHAASADATPRIACCSRWPVSFPARTWYACGYFSSTCLATRL